MTETIYLAGGCFWCTEAIFQSLRGVESIMSGYSGGNLVDPTYDQVTMGNSGHAETIKVTYDSNIIPTHDVLEVFFATHDSTTLNRQGADIGTQYRSVVFYTTEEQSQTAKKLKHQSLAVSPKYFHLKIFILPKVITKIITKKINLSHIVN